MARIKSYSTTAASNTNAATGVNFDENQLPSTVNDSARTLMSDIRAWYEDVEWRDWGHTVTRTANTTFTIATDVTAIYVANRQIRCADSSTLYGYIASSSYSAPNTTVTVTLDSGNLSASLTAVALGLDPSKKSIDVSSVRNAVSSTGSTTFSGNVNFTGDIDVNGSEIPDGAAIVAAAGGATVTSWVPRGYLSGLTLSNNGSDANNDIDIAVGECADSTNVCLMKLTSSITKRLDASWAAGTNQGGLDTGSESTSTWYHVWLIRKDSDGSIDALFSTSVSSPTMPAGYTYKRRLGSVRNDGSSNLLAFFQDGDLFLWQTAVSDVNATNPGTSAVTRTLTVPTGVNVIAWFNAAIWSASSSTQTFEVLFSDLSVGDAAPTNTTQPGASLGYRAGAGAEIEIMGQCEMRTNTSAQIRSRLNFSDANVTLYINTIGWWDSRGRNS